MKKLYYCAIILFLAITGCNRNEDIPASPVTQGSTLKMKSTIVSAPETNPMTKDELNTRIFFDMKAKSEFRWEQTDLRFIWSAIENCRLVAVGYKPTGYGNITPIIHQINIKSSEWKNVHDELIKNVLAEVNKNLSTRKTAEEIIYEDDQTLPIIIFKVTERHAITYLYNLENVRYMEPYGYWPENTRSSSGCNAATEPLNSADYSTITPGALLPWNYNNCNVPAAWNIAQGANIKIGVIDAGISSSQTLLASSGFNSGESNVNRTITTDYTYGTSAYTSCTHGTSMCGLAAGPRNASGATSGIAYKANLHFIRAANDVVLDESAELSGVRNALVKMGKISDLKIISMSVGTPFYSSTLYDGVSYAYNNGKMIFAAAGTSFSWTSWWGVIYPAYFTQCIAITGVQENGSTCNTCHDGSKVAFTIPMSRDVNDNRDGLSLPYSGFTPTYIGGSSCATAMAAGIAAVAWSSKPTLTRAQVYVCLQTTAQYYPNVTSTHGYGNLNAGAATLMASQY